MRKNFQIILMHVCWGWLSCMALHGQGIYISYPDSLNSRLGSTSTYSFALETQNTHQGSDLILAPSKHLVPQYVKDNPLGYSFLCRKELELETRGKVSPWLKAGDYQGRLPNMAGNIQFQLKMRLR